jgi:hypothetical protein
VEQSLVSGHMTADTARYFLLESLRLFAADRLAERSTTEVDEPARLARRHCYHYRDNVVHVQVEWFGAAEQELLNWAMGCKRVAVNRESPSFTTLVVCCISGGSDSGIA